MANEHSETIHVPLKGMYKMAGLVLGSVAVATSLCMGPLFLFTPDGFAFVLGLVASLAFSVLLTVRFMHLTYRGWLRIEASTLALRVDEQEQTINLAAPFSLVMYQCTHDEGRVQAVVVEQDQRVLRFGFGLPMLWEGRGPQGEWNHRLGPMFDAAAWPVMERLEAIAASQAMGLVE